MSSLFNKIKLIIILVLVILLFTGCSSKKNSTIEVRGLTLKMSLFTVAEDVYKANYKNTDLFNEELYSKAGDYGLEYYSWLKNTYTTMDSTMKTRLIKIYDTYPSYTFVDKSISLEDNASAEEIIEYINDKSTLILSKDVKEDIKDFFTYFYSEYLQELIKQNSKNINKEVNRINSSLKRKNIDIFTFMEEKSGVKFKEDRKAIFYYDLPAVGASGYKYKNFDVSTISPNITKQTILNTPFHEFSHELFQSFTRDSEFKEITDRLKNNEELTDGYEKVGKTAYDWIGWCEENLVEGFADYLKYKYYDEKTESKTYVYDLDFYNYLVNSNFNPSNISLKAASIEFYNSVLEAK